MQKFYLLFFLFFVAYFSVYSYVFYFGGSLGFGEWKIDASQLKYFKNKLVFNQNKTLNVPSGKAGFPSPIPLNEEPRDNVQVSSIADSADFLWWNQNNTLYFYQYPRIKSFKYGNLTNVFTADASEVKNVKYFSGVNENEDYAVVHAWKCGEFDKEKECTKFLVVNLDTKEENNDFSVLPGAYNTDANGNIFGFWGEYKEDGMKSWNFRVYRSSQFVENSQLKGSDFSYFSNNIAVDGNGRCFSTEYVNFYGRPEGIGIWCRNSQNDFSLIKKIAGGKAEEMFFVDIPGTGLVYIDKDDNLNVAWKKSDKDWVTDEILTGMKGNNLKVNIDQLKHSGNVVYAVFESHRGGTAFWSVNLVTKETKKIVDAEYGGGQIEDFRISPDGKMIAIIKARKLLQSQKGELEILNLEQQ